jgi:hypothetical protein
VQSLLENKQAKTEAQARAIVAAQDSRPPPKNPRKQNKGLPPGVKPYGKKLVGPLS